VFGSLVVHAGSTIVEFASVVQQQEDVRAQMEQLMRGAENEFRKLEVIRAQPWGQDSDDEERAVLKQYQQFQDELFADCYPKLRELSKRMAELAGMFSQYSCSLFFCE
jgi:hypothetical protein